MILLFKMVPDHSAEMLSSIPEMKEAVMGLVEKTRVLNKLCSGMSCAVSHEFSVTSQLYIYIYKYNRCI